MDPLQNHETSIRLGGRQKRSLWRAIARHRPECLASLLHCTNSHLQTKIVACHCCDMGISTGPRRCHADPSGPISCQTRQFSVRPAVLSRPNGVLLARGNQRAAIPLRFRERVPTSPGTLEPAMHPSSARLVFSGSAPFFPMHACVVFTTSQSKSVKNSRPDVDQFRPITYIARWSNFLDNRG
jgi:hypothetical protein